MAVTDSNNPLFSFGGPNNDTTNQGAYATTLFKRTFGGEILTEFREATIFRDLHMTRQIENGKAAKFPVFGRASHKYFTPGDDLYTTTTGAGADATDGTADDTIDDSKTSIIGRSERLIYINELCLAATLVDQVDELMDDYNGVRGIYSQELGRALANNYDQMVAKAIFAAASQVAPAPVAGGPVGGGAIAINLNAATSSEAKGDLLVGALFDAAQKLDEADVPKADRYCALAPQEYYDLVNSKKAVNRDYAGSGSIAGGSVLSVAGINIVMTNHLPHADNSSGTGTVIDGNRNTDLNINYGGTNPATDGYLNGLVFQKQAAATASLMDLAFETEWDIRKQAWVMVAKMAVGHGVLRPECAVKITQGV